MNWLSPITDLVPQGPPDGPEFRRRVQWMILLRIMVTSILLGVTIFLQLRETHAFLVASAVPLYILIITTFLLSIIYAVSLPLLPELRTFSFLQILVDLVYIDSTDLFYGRSFQCFHTNLHFADHRGRHFAFQTGRIDCCFNCRSTCSDFSLRSNFTGLYRRAIGRG